MFRMMQFTISHLSMRINRGRRFRRHVAFMVAVLLTAVATSIVNVYHPYPCGAAVEAFATPKQQRRQSPSSPSGSRKKRPSKIGGGNKNWYDKRKAGVKVQSRGPKPPKWEKEGDDLYVNNNIIQNDAKIGDSDGSSTQFFTNKKDMTYEDARELLRPFEDKPRGEKSVVPESSTTKTPAPDDNEESNDDKPFLWGGLSVGPVWKSRLVGAGYPKPTPIQVETYATLLNKKNQTSINGNAVIAASTGSGKSLAYLLPFLTSIDANNRKKKTKQMNRDNVEPSAHAQSVTSALGKIWIVTPTMELAYQLQRTVDKVVVSDEDKNTSSSDVLHVVEYKRRMLTPKESAETDSSFSLSFPILADIIDRYYINDSSRVSQEPTFFAGTPKLFVQLRKEIKKILASTTKADSNIRYAKQRQARKLREASEGIEYSNDEKGDHDENDNIEEQLLYRKVALAIDNNLETLILDEVDRLLQTTTAMARREHKTTKPLAQELLEALVWESKKKPSAPNLYGRKNGRPASFTPSSYSSKLQIVCASATVGRSLRRQLMYITRAPSMDKAAILITADVRTKKNAELRKASLLPSNLKHSYQIVSANSDRSENAAVAAATATLRALVTTLQSQNPKAPSLVFPGTIGVETVRDHLLNFGFRDVRGLSSLRSDSNNNKSDKDASGLDAPVYVVKERLARGLDLPEVRRVFLLGVPSNAAAYAHLAGRTARQNTPGECTVLCKPSEAPKLASIAETLGIYRWKCLCEESHIPAESESGSESDKVERGKVEWDLATMTKTSVKSKKVSELREFLESKGVSTKGLLKDSLVGAVLSLKDE